MSEHLQSLIDDLAIVLREHNPDSHAAVLALMTLASSISFEALGYQGYIDYLKKHIKAVQTRFEALSPEEKRNIDRRHADKY